MTPERRVEWRDLYVAIQTAAAMQTAGQDVRSLRQGITDQLKRMLGARFDDSSVCQTCDDVGLERCDCRPSVRCAMHAEKAPSDPLLRHTYVIPCACAAGDKWRTSLAAAAGKGSRLTSVGKVGARRRTFSRAVPPLQSQPSLEGTNERDERANPRD